MTLTRSTGFFSRKFSIEPVPNTTGSLSLSVHIPSPAAPSTTMVSTCTAGDGMWTLNDKLPVVFGTGSMLNFLEKNPVERVNVIYKPLQWNVSERIVLIESRGRLH